MDEYYYYAVCIFLISAFSIGTTVLETRSVCLADDGDRTSMTDFQADYASVERDIPVRVRRPCSPERIL